ncbi:MAG: fucose isomerase [Planctomycetota bacterium]|nr:fucose isomerase [Planctomycetota bacterium]
MPRKKTMFGIIIGVRGFFNPGLAVDDRADLYRLLDDLGIGRVTLEPEATPSGAIETMADAEKLAALFRSRQDDLDGVAVLLPNFGDEQAVAETLKMAKLGVPVLVQASNDEIGKVDLASRRDAFCGKLSVCNNLRQYGIPFTDTSSHTCDVGGPGFRRDVEDFAALCRVVRGLRSARIGLLGVRPAAFQTVRCSEKLLQASGIKVIPVDLSVIIAAARKVGTDEPDYRRKLEEILAYAEMSPRPETIEKIVKYTVAVERFVRDNDLDATAVQCWDSLEANYGCGSCLTQSLMSNRLKPSACEGDIAGAASMLALALAAGRPAALLDWNNNYGSEPDTLVATHCSNYPADFMGTRPEVGTMGVLSTTIGAEVCFGAVKGRVLPGEMTFFRLSTEDTGGYIKAYVGEGEFLDRPFGMDGGIAVCRIKKMRKLFRFLCANGFEHHVAMVRTPVARIIDEAAGKYLGWRTHWHNMPDELDVPVI